MAQSEGPNTEPQNPKVFALTQDDVVNDQNPAPEAEAFLTMKAAIEEFFPCTDSRDSTPELPSAALTLAAAAAMGVGIGEIIDHVTAKPLIPSRPNSMADIVAKRMRAPLFTSMELSKTTRQQRRAAVRKADLATIKRTMRKLSRRERRALVMA